MSESKPMSDKATPATPHTPGPWETVGSTHIAKFGTDWAHIAIVCSPRGPNGDDDPAATRATAVELGEPRFHEACANARLIASAPDLLRQNEELRSALRKVIDRMKLDHNGAETCEDRDCEGCKALAEAERVLDRK